MLQWVQTPQGSTVISPEPFGPIQFKLRAIMRAVVVLPTPRTPVNIKACAIRPLANALVKIRTNVSCPMTSFRTVGRYLRARTR